MQRILYAASPSIYRLVQNVHTLAFKYGQWRSIRAIVPVRNDGTPLPWYTYPAIEYLSQFDLSDCRVFEFGAGNSSIFWAERAMGVVSVESDAKWFQFVRQRLMPNQQLLLRETQSEYVRALAEQDGNFDFVVVDGKWRLACAEEAANALPDGGAIVLDNSDKYPDVAHRLRDRGFFEIDFNGFGPINNYTWTTSIFLRAQCRLQRNFRAPRPIAGRGQVATGKS